ncbi:MAG: hypothetical protein R3D85_09755 [Paracoccaceae bacterium]
MSRKPVEKKKPKKRGARPGRGTLLLISSLLMGSAFVRLGNDAGQAIARQSDPAQQGAGHAAMAEPHGGTMAAGHGQSCEPPPDIAAMLTAFQQRETRLKERESQINARMQALSVVDREVSTRMAALSQAEEQLRGTLALADAAAENDLSKLTTVYESMKPKDAAALFEEMDPAFSAGFLGRMRPEAAAAIMSGLSPQTAYTVSAILAGRNAEVPKE